MIEQKQNDWIVNILGNLHLSTADLEAAGLSADNTSLLSEDTYKQSKQITENPLFLDELGNFDNTKFHKFYLDALLTYNMLANDTYLNEMAKQLTVFGKDDIFAPKEQRRSFEDTVQYFRMPNPDRQTSGLVRIGETESPTLSRSEIAQTQKVLNNPTSAGDDLSKAEWKSSPNESWFEDFFDTRVLAQWDEEGTHIDPITGKEMKHEEGLLKLNENGTYYYENLDGRDVYGRLVLNKMNTLTTDGSEWNKYDFFDSDDLELKSIGGSVLKNVALVGSMFIPYVGPVIAGASIASLLYGLTGTLGKMLLGSDSPTFSSMEGWAKSVSSSTALTQYALLNTWCWENFINLIGNVAGQLRELRFLFEYAPALFKGTKVLDLKKGVTKEKQVEYAEELAKKYKKIHETLFSKLGELRDISGKDLKYFATAKSAEQYLGQLGVEAFMKDYNKIGEILSKGYMTAITVGDTYGEAKLAGASDLEASLLTLGYAATELKLLNTDLGNWILPELKASGVKTQKMIKAIAEVSDSERRAVQNLNKEGKLNFIKKWFNKGKELYNSSLAESKGLSGMALLGALGEGFEEVSEEFLADFSKSCFNVVLWLLGDDKTRMDAFDKVGDRYLMSLLGGAVGGGITAVTTDFNINMAPMTSEQAMLELVYKLKNGEKEQIYKSLEKITLANKYLQNDVSELGAFKPATPTSSNMDKDVKKAFTNLVENIDALIKTEGLDIPDNLFISKLLFDDLKIALLALSKITGLYLQDFNTLCTKIVEKKNEINTLESRSKDSGKSNLEVEAITKLRSELVELLAKKDAYLNGDLAMSYISKSLFDLSKAISSKFSTVFFKDYAENIEKKKFDKISEDRKKELKELYDSWIANEAKNDVSNKADLYLNLARNSGEFIKNFAANYDNLKNSLSLLQLINAKNSARQQLMAAIDPSKVENETLELVNENKMDLDTWLQSLLKIDKEEVATTIHTLLFNNSDLEFKDRIISLLEQASLLDENSPTYKEDLKRISLDVASLEYALIALDSLKYFLEFTELGALNPIIKHLLNLALENTKLHTNRVLSELNKFNSSEEILEGINMFGGSYTENTTIEELLNDPTISPLELSDYFGVQADLIIPALTTIGELYNQKVTTLKDLDNLKSNFNTMLSNLDTTKKKLDNVTYTDAISFILNFILSNSNSKLDMPKLLEDINSLMDLDLEDVELEGRISQVKEAIEVINWLQGLVIGALYDSDADLFNMVGYNTVLNKVAKLHNVKDWIELPEISIQNSAIINQDLLLIKDRLVLAQNVYYINLGKKLNLLNKVSVNKSFIDYNRLKKFIVTIGDEWKEKNKLEEALDKLTIHKLFAEARNYKGLNEEQREKIESEKRDINQAIFDFFKTNQNIIDRGDLYKLFINGFDLYSPTEQILNEDTEVLEDQNFLYLLASRAAINVSDFYNEFNLVLDPENGIAAIPTLEEAIFLNIAFALNGKMIDKFREAWTKAAIHNFLNATNDVKEDILKNKLKKSSDQVKLILASGNLYDIDALPIYSNIFLTEGFPGSGKSKAVTAYTLKILKKFHPELLLKVWYAHNNKSAAEEALKGLTGEAFNHDSLMTKIYSPYNTSRAITKTGDKIYSDDEFIRTSDGRLKFKFSPDDTSDIPSLIIIDEISHYDLADLDLIDDFAKRYGITVLSAGDFDQSSVSAKIPGDVDILLSPKRVFFPHSTKLGVSMRTTNSLMNKSVNNLLDYVRSDLKKPAEVYYYEDKAGLRGVKSLETTDIDEIEKTIKTMVDTLKDGLKIGFIYTDEESKVLKLLEEKFSDKFEKFYGTSAQGFEGQYYIIDTVLNAPSAVTKAKDLFTGVTRSELGTLVIGSNQIKSYRESVTSDSSYSVPALKRYSKKRKELITKTYTSTKTLEYKQRDKESGLTTVTAPPKVPSPITSTPPATPTAITWDGEVKKIVNNGDVYYTDGKTVAKEVNGNLEVIPNSELLWQDIIDVYSLLTKLPEEIIHPDETNEIETKKAVVDLNNAVSESPEVTPYTYLLHSHNTYELGVKFDNRGNITFHDSDLGRYNYRIDSAIGLMKIFESDWTKPNNNIQFYKDLIGLMRSIIFNTEDEQEIVDSIESVLRSNNDSLRVSKIDFGLISTPNISEKNKQNGLKWGNTNNVGPYGVFDRHLDETTIGNSNPDPESLKINRKTLSAVVYLTNGLAFSLPLFVLGNLETYTRNPQNDISKKLKEIYDKVGLDSYKFHVEVLNSTEIPQNLRNLARLYLFTNGAFFKIDKLGWTPARNLKNYGMQVNVDAISGTKFPFDGSESFVPITKFLENSSYHVSKKIYSSTKKVSNGDNLIPFSNTGHPFILVSTDDTLDTDRKLEDLYISLLCDPSLPKKVTLVYILPPKVGMDQYLRNLYNLIKGSKNVKKLGSHLTSYYTWKALLPILLDENSSISLRLDKATREKIILEVSRLLEIENKAATETDLTKLANLRTLLLNEVLYTLEWTGVNTGNTKLSLLQHLNYSLLSIFTDMNGLVIEENLNELVKALESQGLKSVYYSTKFENTKVDPTELLSPLQSDYDVHGNCLYSIDGLPFSINAKIDSNLFSQGEEFDDIIESFVNKIVPHDKVPGIYVSKDTGYFINMLELQEDDGEYFVFDSNIWNLDRVEVIDGKVNIKGFTYDESSIVTLDLVKSDINKKLKDIKSLNKEDIIKKIYNDYVYLLTNGINDINEAVFNVLNELLLDFNLADNNSIIYSFNDIFVEKKFDKDKLETYGILGIIIKDALYNNSVPNNGILKVQTTKGDFIEINVNTKEVSIDIVGELQVNNFDTVDLSAIEDPNILEAIDIITRNDIEGVLTSNMEDFGTNLMDFKGLDEVTDLIEQIILVESTPTLELILKYLKDEDISCSIKLYAE